eukprot:682176-Amphidinium_carterae.1
MRPSSAPLVATSGSRNIRVHGMLTCLRTRASAEPSSCMARSKHFASSTSIAGVWTRYCELKGESIDDCPMK